MSGGAYGYKDSVVRALGEEIEAVAMRHRADPDLGHSERSIELRPREDGMTSFGLPAKAVRICFVEGTPAPSPPWTQCEPDGVQRVEVKAWLESWLTPTLLQKHGGMCLTEQRIEEIEREAASMLEDAAREWPQTVGRWSIAHGGQVWRPDSSGRPLRLTVTRYMDTLKMGLRADLDVVIGELAPAPTASSEELERALGECHQAVHVAVSLPGRQPTGGASGARLGEASRLEEERRCD